MQILQANVKWAGTLQPFNIEGLKYIVLHHMQAKTATVEQIHEWHLENGWLGIAYNEFISKDGTVYICRGDFIGGHVRNLNSISYGIGCEGDYEVETEMPTAQLLALTERVKYNKNRFPASVDIVKHSKLCDTSCPGKHFPFGKILNGVTMPLLRFGAKGESVSFLQHILSSQGYGLGNVDGVFGCMTNSAVKRFQHDQKITEDGIVGSITWGRLIKR